MSVISSWSPFRMSDVDGGGRGKGEGERLWAVGASLAVGNAAAVAEEEKADCIDVAAVGVVVGE